MGLQQDLRRFREVGEERRMDLSDFIQHGDLKAGDDDISVPVKQVQLPEFVYDKRQQGGVGQGEGAEEGDPVEDPREGDGDEAGDGEGDHGILDMTPEEFADALDEEFELELEPKGKQVIDTEEGDFTDIGRTGPRATLDVEHLYKEGLKRTLAMSFDEEWCRDLLRVQGVGPQRAFEYAREQRIPVSKQWFVDAYETIDDTDRYDSIDDIGRTPERAQPMDEVTNIDIRPDDERYKYPEIIEEKQNNVVVVNIRDVSGSMREDKRDLVERVFVPLDWYLQGKYDHAEFIYIAHDVEAWEVEREEFFGIESGGGTQISSAYELAQELLEQYPYNKWNRFVFGAGDGENASSDTTDNLAPLVDEIDANMHAYVEVGTPYGQSMIKELTDATDRPVTTTSVQNRAETVSAVERILRDASIQNGSDET